MNVQIYNRYVLLIAEYKSITRAAAAAGVSQPALSSGLSALENKLGFEIFCRKSIPFTFTDKGLLYYEYIKKTEALEKDFRSQIDALDNGGHESFSIGGPTAYVESIITTALCRSDCDFRDCNITIRNAPLAGLIEQCSRNELDCFISTTDNIPSDFEKRLLKHEQIYLVIHRDNPVNARLEQFRLADFRQDTQHPDRTFDYSILSGERFIVLERNLPMQRQMEELFAHYGICPSGYITVNQVSTALNLALRGYGICMASEASLLSHSDLSAVCIYALPDIIMGRNIYVAYNKNALLPTACRGFIDYLVQLNGAN